MESPTEMAKRSSGGARGATTFDHAQPGRKARSASPTAARARPATSTRRGRPPPHFCLPRLHVLGLAPRPVERRTWRLAFLGCALLVVALSAYAPHWRPGEPDYRFPVHLDEYWHWGIATSIQRDGLALSPTPFFGSGLADDTGFQYPTEIHERGYHAYLAALQGVTGIEWVTLLRFLPVV